MITIAKHQLIDGLRDAKFLFLAAVVLAAFVANAFIYTERHKLAMEDWQENIANTTEQLSGRAVSLLQISTFAQRMVKTPSVLTFIADGGEEMLPNRLLVNAFTYGYPENQTRGNEMFELLPSVDWVFIVGTLMSLLAVMLSFGSICGEKRDGTLQQVLSYPVSRFTLFMGKFIGLLTVLIITLVLGAAINLAILYLNGILPVSVQIASIIGWALVLSVLFLSLVLLLGMAVSAIVHRPAISLVILMVIWLIAMVAVPGMARLFGENTVDVPSPFAVDQAIEDSFYEIWNNAPEGAGNWDDDPRYAFSEPARRRAETVTKIVFERTRIMTDAMNDCVRQVESIRGLYCASPAFLMENALQKLCGTGISGFKSFFDNAQRYHKQLSDYTVNKDAADPDSPHTVYSWGFSATDNTFSMKPVEFSTFPRYHTLWREGGLYTETDWPWFHILIFIGINLAAAAVAFFAFARYDPR
jgi:ABC-type transport system involved in multi-copper enzyme maturation permease subunit